MNKSELMNDIENIVKDNLQYFEKALNNLDFESETIKYDISILLIQTKYNILKYILEYIYNNYD